MDSARRAAIEAHLGGCSSCYRYAKVLQQGVAELNSLPTIVPSEDFLPRLQNRLYAIDDGYDESYRRTTSGTSVGFVVTVVLLIGFAAWVPMLRPDVAVVALPPVEALAPGQDGEVHTLFRAGPLLTRASSTSTAFNASFTGRTSTPTLFSRYAPRGSRTQVEASHPR